MGPVGAIPSSLHRTPCASVPGCLGCSGMPGEPAPRQAAVWRAWRTAWCPPTAYCFLDTQEPCGRCRRLNLTCEARHSAHDHSKSRSRPTVGMAKVSTILASTATIATTAGASSGTHALAHAHKYQAHVPKVPSNKKKRNSQAGGDGGGGSMIPALQASHGGLSSPAEGPHGGRSRGARPSTWLSPLL